MGIVQMDASRHSTDLAVAAGPKVQAPLFVVRAVQQHDVEPVRMFEAMRLGLNDPGSECFLYTGRRCGAQMLPVKERQVTRHMENDRLPLALLRLSPWPQ